MDVEMATAAWVIRDVTISRDCKFSPARSGSRWCLDLIASDSLNGPCATDSFLMDAFDPKYLYW